MFLARRLVPAVLVLLAAAPIQAAVESSGQEPQREAVNAPVAVSDPSVVTGLPGVPGATPMVADPAAGIPDLPANQAEIEALRSGAMTLERPAGTDAAAPADAARTERRAAFDAVIDGQRQKIQALIDRLEAGSGGADAAEIQKEIEREKMSTQRQLLEVQLDFATRDGDQARIDQLQAAIANWDAPRPVVQSVVDRPVPINPVR
ncbi:MAG: hypothetical protein IPO18_02395 [bacterium]|nr:hypothetical protein [bacterium]MBK9471120.1 hypothetical protein [bacterium]